MSEFVQSQNLSLSATGSKPTALIVTVDTEEEGLWGGEYRREGNTVRNIAGIERFQQICDQFEVRPTYLVDTPVVENDQSAELLKGIQDAGRCEIGAHLHPWCAPPFDETISAKNSYQCNLPESLQREKMEILTDRIETRFGRRSTSYRAGRYGLDIVGARILEQLGYVVDSSVICFTNYADRGGPDFSQAPFVPYRVGGDDLAVPDPSGKLLEVPVSVGYSRAGFDTLHRIRSLAGRWPWRHLRAVGILDRLNIARRIKMSPEQATSRRMQQLVDAMRGHQAPCVVMMLHSSSLVTGESPYASSVSALEELYTRLSETLEYCVRRHGMVGSTLTEFAQRFNNP